MQEKKKLKLKKFYIHPIIIFIILTVAVLLLSAIFSAFEMQATYNTINQTTKELEPTLVTVENLLSFQGFKYIFSNAVRGFISFSPLSMLIISLIGIGVAKATGLIDTLAKLLHKKISKNQLTFVIIFLGVISSLINDVGYTILIPLSALLYESQKRNPLLGIITAFCGVAFGYGVSIFVGSQEVSLIPYTKLAAELIDTNIHISLTSNLFFIIVASILISIIGTIIINKLIAPKIPKYHFKDKITGETLKTTEIVLTDIEEEEKEKIIREKSEKRGLKFSLITSIVLILMLIYMLIPNLPGSGLLLDTSEKIYLNQVFGSNAYLQDSFTYIISLFFIIVGISYGIGAHSIKNDKDLILKIDEIFKNIGPVILLIFVASQFISIWKKTNIGIIITTWLANLLNYLEFSGIPLIIIVMLFIAISNIFSTSISTKWMIFSPIVIPIFMQGNISPQFAQIIMRAGESMTNGITPIMASFVIYLGYLNMYNQSKDKPITIKKAINLILPYALIISAVWILLIVCWYIVGLPIGPNVFPTL
ncbi:MAG: AbgT family transporter [Bacilli bacterium]|nr:AbgT family transporter [Bacilli bacterium]